MSTIVICGNTCNSVFTCRTGFTFFTFRTIINSGVGFRAIRVSNSERMSTIMVINYSSCSVFTCRTGFTFFTFFTFFTVFHDSRRYGAITIGNVNGVSTIVICGNTCNSVFTCRTGFTFFTTSPLCTFIPFRAFKFRVFFNVVFIKAKGESSLILINFNTIATFKCN